MNDRIVLSMMLLSWFCGCDRPKSASDDPPATSPVVAVESSARPASTPVPDDIRELYTSYKRLELMTPEPVNIAPGTLMIAGCRGPAPEEVAAGLEKFGPHSLMSINVYMNASAASAYAHLNKGYPMGSVVVKEKKARWGNMSTPMAGINPHDGVGGMVKREPGYDPAHGDWEYFYGDSTQPLISGKISNCVACHSKASGRDYIFGDWKSGSGYWNESPQRSQ
jgi:hypothetical protein